MESFVYILKCADNSYYVGVTSNLYDRISEHNSGKYRNSYTFNRLPVTLVFYTTFTEITTAIEFEKKLKKWSRSKKEALIHNKFDTLPNLSKKNFNIK